MAKTRKFFLCTECGEKSLRWTGQCLNCRTWNSLVETEEENSRTTDRREIPEKLPETGSLAPDAAGASARITSGLSGFDRVLGGGFVPGGTVLFGGEPGIGKSTMLLEISRRFGKEILYISGEENTGQIRERAARMKVENPRLKLAHAYELSEVLGLMKKWKPDLLMIDSIQTVQAGRGFAGSTAQIRESAAEIMEAARSDQIAVLMTGHVTKDGQIAGPRQLEHAVDTVIYFENHGWGNIRLLRSVKNRFGSTGEISLYDMTSSGLSEVSPRELVMDEFQSGGIGNIVFLQKEGSIILPLEIQALVTPTSVTAGRRIGENIDNTRIHLAAAILEKYLSFRMSQCDIFIKVRGTAPLTDPAGDLPLLVALMSSYLEKPVPPGTVSAGEAALTGVFRESRQWRERQEAAKAMKFRAGIWAQAPADTLQGGWSVSDVRDLAAKLFDYRTS